MLLSTLPVEAKDVPPLRRSMLRSILASQLRQPWPSLMNRSKQPWQITWPHGCNLKDRTATEQMIGEKYLRRWGILVDDLQLFED